MWKTAFKKSEGLWSALADYIPSNFLKAVCLPQNSINPLLNTLSELFLQKKAPSQIIDREHSFGFDIISYEVSGPRKHSYHFLLNHPHITSEKRSQI